MIFNTSGDRDPQVLLTPFLSCHLDLVIFTTNLSGLQGAVDQENFTTTDKIQFDRFVSQILLIAYFDRVKDKFSHRSNHFRIVLLIFYLQIFAL